MPIGTVLAPVLDVSTTLGNQTMTFNTNGVDVVQRLLGNGTLYVCIMGFHLDYNRIPPSLGGDYTAIRVGYSEMSGTSKDPRIRIVYDDESTDNIYSSGSGDSDDAYVQNFFYNPASLNWEGVVGNHTTVGTGRGDHNSSTTGIYNFYQPGRGGDIFVSCMRSYFAFDFSGLSSGDTIHAGGAGVILSLYLDNTGTTTGDFGKIIAIQSTALAGSTADYGNCFQPDNATFFGANF